jgi:DNA-binding protein YbaB
MTFEDYWDTQPKTLDEETNDLMKQIAEHAWNKATEKAKKQADKDILEIVASMETGIIIY